MNLDKKERLLRKEALEYHEAKPRGKIKVVPTKPHSTAHELSLAYSPGVAYPCLDIAERPEDAYRYTSKGNLVAVISNGTAVLGLGNIGALASKPVMEGKGLLLKTFADIDVFDIEVDTEDPESFIETVVNISKTFGGINLEDIKAPECFEIERRIAEATDIPVMHDDQHGTAIISAAALLNAVEIQEKSLDTIKVVVIGAGASAIACANHYVSIGVTRKNISMVDSKGIVTKARLEAGELNEYKAPFAHDREAGDLADALRNADVMLGLSRGGLVNKEMVASMAKKPIIFALANPTPEITPEQILEVRDDAIIATGRSDYPNQVNNVLGFPYIFRGALDVRARDITQGMKMAATRALALLAKEPVPDYISAAYDGATMQYGPEYIIPKPFDRRVLIWEASAVAQAAVQEGVAAVKPEEFSIVDYREKLEARLGLSYSIMRHVINQVRGRGKRIVFPEGDNEKVLRAAAQLVDQKICYPILLGPVKRIETMIEELGLHFEYEVFDPRKDKRRKGIFAEKFMQKRSRKGLTYADAHRLLKSRPYFASQMVVNGDADGFVGGVSRNYGDVLRPTLELIGADENSHCVVGCYMMNVKGRTIFLADATVNVYPDSRTLAEIAVQTAKVARRFGVDPRVAMLSFSNFGSSRAQRSERIEDAIEFARELDPSLVIDGPMQADTALNGEVQIEYPFMDFNGPANVLVLPNLAAANIAYKLLEELGDAEMTGPILEGMQKPVQLVARQDGVRHIVNMAAICAADAIRQDSYWESLVTPASDD
ncbi:MAG: NADP-dependent malic enzyme [Euryarchaeota archaeon]|jgi:malate dehydrogenase (oxaloacetate-decarboxylating)(NADP+)|nr:NADP-dependent malic enzyme [Euryarchaeota archaeon]MBT5595232.1 NADP-dependent malic enzyme [Euryarchaeota archaeon]MBT5844298.1 NADP-dependent malic enzyme [Euryarchaeota archaeon]MBT6640316.1 NADP-dependent malic enzyme [Euryarchaeota archaeon]MBT7063504.1 NADP-dependent malic enzyme [Euryarchaeota archaeon]